MTIEELLGHSAEQLESMTDAQLEAALGPYLKESRPPGLAELKAILEEKAKPKARAKKPIDPNQPPKPKRKRKTKPNNEPQTPQTTSDNPDGSLPQVGDRELETNSPAPPVVG